MKRKLLLSIVVLSCVFVNTCYAQINWTKYIFNPILSPGLSGTFSELGFPFTYVLKENDTLKMWYSAADMSHNRIGFAWSTDCVNFEFTDDPLFEQSGVQGTFDREGVSGANVLKIEDLYYMWYNGNNMQPYMAGNLQVGLATSGNGKIWQRYSNQPVLPVGAPGSWDDRWAYCNTVLYEDGMFKMWYSGDDGSIQNIGYATSTNGMMWTKYEGNPIMSLALSEYIHNARVLNYGGQYHMWFNIFMNNKEFLYYSTSVDGIEWDEPVLAMSMGFPGSFDDDWVWCPTILLDESGVLNMWYTGSSQGVYSIGYAIDSTLVDVNSPELPSIDLTIDPNPALSQTVISFSILKTSSVVLSIYNLTGKQIMQPVNEILQPGNYSHTFDVSRILPGTYLCRLQTDFSERSVKLIIGK